MAPGTWSLLLLLLLFSAAAAAAVLLQQGDAVSVVIPTHCN